MKKTFNLDFNDDRFLCQGIRALISVMEEVGDATSKTVFTPNEFTSAMGLYAIHYLRLLHLNKKFKGGFYIKNMFYIFGRLQH
jgi:hypothetical protein